METFEIKSFNDKELVLTDSEQVSKLYTILQNEEAIQLIWKDRNIKKSQIVIATNIAGKVRTGEMVVKSEEEI